MSSSYFRRHTAGLLAGAFAVAGCAHQSEKKLPLAERPKPGPQVPATTALTATDSQGNTVVAGTFTGRLQLRELSAASEAGADGYVAKIGPQGMTFLRAFGGPNDQTVMSMVLDAEDNIIVAGTFHKTMAFDGQPLQVPDQVPLTRGVYVAKLDKGGKPLWSRLMARVAAATSVSVAVRPDGVISVGASIIGPAQVDGKLIPPQGSVSMLFGKVTAAGEAAPAPNMALLAPLPLAQPLQACAHDICVEGVGLNPSCHWCVNLIVNQVHDTYCRDVWWDWLCVWEVGAYCGINCNTPPPH